MCFRLPSLLLFVDLIDTLSVNLGTTENFSVEKALHKDL